MIANDPNIMMAEKMAYSRHSNPSSHIAYIRAGHNSDFAFQKAISGAPMPKKQEIPQQKSVATKVIKRAKQGSRKLSPCPRKQQNPRPGVLQGQPPKQLAYTMKAPPKSSVSHSATSSAVR
jgi:hypothetical protein